MKIENLQTFFPLLLISIFSWHSNISTASAFILNQNPAPFTLTLPISSSSLPQENRAVPNQTVQEFREALTNYAELANAYYSPAQDETVREKRTLGVIRRLANVTRSGVSTIRGLFSGGTSSSTGAGGGFRNFFSNFLNRFLVFLTNLWDRITGFFNRGGSSSGSGGGGSGGGVLGRLGSLFSIFRPPTTTESYFDSDFSYYSSSTAAPENDNELVASVDETASDAAGTKPKTGDDSTNNADSDDIPFPGDPDINTRSGKASEGDIGSAVGSSSEPKSTTANVSSPKVIHVIDDGRRFA